MGAPVGKPVAHVEVVHAWITVPPVVPYPSPTSLVLLGSAQVLGIRMVPVGKRTVEGGGVLIPAHGLGLADVQVMLVPVMPGRPRASMTAPVAVIMPFCGFRMKLRTLQMLVFDAPNLLASTNAEEPTTVFDAL
jgi:hypothetical protein